MSTSAIDLRQRVAGWQRAERRERSLRAESGPMAPDASLSAAFELYDLLPVDCRAPDVTWLREVDVARRTWHTLRIRLTPR